MGLGNLNLQQGNLISLIMLFIEEHSFLEQSGTKPKMVTKILATKFGNHLCIGYQNW